MKILYSLFFLLIFIIPEFTLSAPAAQNEIVDNFIITSENEYIHPFTFEYSAENNSINLGFLWVKYSLNDSEHISLKTFDGLKLSKEYNITEMKHRGTFNIPQACQLFDAIYITWLEKTNESYDIILRPLYYRNMSVGKIFRIAENLKSENLDLRIIEYNEMINIYWNHPGPSLGYEFHHAVFDPKTNITAQPTTVYLGESHEQKKAFSPWLYSIYKINGELFIGFELSYKLGAEPTIPYYFVRINQTHPSVIDISNTSCDLLDIIHQYYSGEYLFGTLRMESIKTISSESKTFINCPGPLYQLGEQKYLYKWVINEYQYGMNPSKNITIVNDTRFITKSTIYYWNDNIHIIYINNETSNNEKIQHLILSDEHVQNGSVIANNCSFDYNLFQITCETKCYLTLNAIKNYKYQMLWCIWLHKNLQKKSYIFEIKLVDYKPNIIANIVASGNSVLTYENITFYSSRYSDDDYQFLYIFGDGTETGWINRSSIKHYYQTDGQKIVKLKIKNNSGLESNWDSIEITIINNPPNVSLESDQQIVLTTTPLLFTSKDTYDLDGYIILYTWDFGDNTTGIGQNITHEYQDNGMYTITLKVIDNDLAENTTAVQIIVNNRVPSIDAKLKSRAMTGERVVLDASGSSDRDGRIVQWRWTVEGKTLDGLIINHSFQHQGKYIIRLAITDDDGAVTEKIFEITVMEAKINPETINWLPLIILIIIGMVIAGIWKRMHKSSLNRSK